jgi:hypothetical protein
MTPITPRSRCWGGMLSFTAASLVLGLAGCTAPTASVSGKVTYKDKAVRSGNVLFIGSDSRTYYAQIADDGAYTVNGLPPGLAKIAVSSPDPKGGGGERGRAEGDAPREPAGRGEDPPAVAVKGWFAIPNDYSDYNKSNQSFDVRPGPNTFNIELK